MLLSFLVRPYVENLKTLIICSFGVTFMVGYGLWFQSGWCSFQLFMATLVLMLISFVVLEVFAKTLGMRLLLFEFRFFLLSGKIAIEGFSTTSQISLRLLQKRLNSKRFGGWNRTTSCSILTTLIGDWIIYIVFKRLCNC